MSARRASAPAYLLLLGLAQRCRCQGKSLLKFLLSGEKDEKDVDAFTPLKRRRKVSEPGPHTRKKTDATERAIPVATATSNAGSAVSGVERQRLVELERENGELRRATEILRAGSV